MRLVSLFRHRRRLLMQLDRAVPTKRASSTFPTTLSSCLKRRGPDMANFNTAAKFARHSPTDSRSAIAKKPPPLPPREHEKKPSRNDPPQSSTKPSRKPDSNASSSSIVEPRSPAAPNKPPTKSRPALGGEESRTTEVSDGPIQDLHHISNVLYPDIISRIKAVHRNDPMSLPNSVALRYTGEPITYKSRRVQINKNLVFRTEAIVPTDPPIIGVGDHAKEASSRRFAALALLCELEGKNMLYTKPKSEQDSITLPDGQTADFERCKTFMEYYCARFHFKKAEVEYIEKRGAWDAVLSVEGRKIGLGLGASKKQAMHRCYLDVVEYLVKCDPELWENFKVKATNVIIEPQRLTLHLSYNLASRVRDLIVDLKSSELYKKRPALAAGTISDASSPSFGSTYHEERTHMGPKSQELQQRLKAYLENPAMEKMRATRLALPVHTRAEDVLSAIEQNDVIVLMAATGSGKTTQVPQIVLDSYINRGKGADCNVLCTQPRRLAALSVAHRVANERGEQLGKSVGYVVRFEARPPEPNGSINFCTIGIFLKKLQAELAEGRRGLDSITHIIVDEVHERDVDTDLLLVVLKRLLADRKARGKPLKIILMSATIDPTLFQNYFPTDQNLPAPVIEVPGRAFPVERHFLDDFLNDIRNSLSRWILREDSVVKYLIRELGVAALQQEEINTQRYDIDRIMGELESEIEIPYHLVAATIAHVLAKSDSGHVLTFLGGWDDISAVQKILLNPSGPLPIDFNDTKYSIHILHSSVPLAEQQVIFEPPREGVRRIILATNIAETSVTIPDVVYVVDSARLKEQRYDPEKHVSSLVSAWVGSSNLNQRAGRAGRHRPGEYYGVLGKNHAIALNPYQTVEMSRVDLSNVVMHIKALNFPGMTVEEVLGATIEPPQPERVSSAMKTLQMVGALDNHQNLTSLGRVLLQIPVDVQVGRLVLFGSFFRCLDQALSLAALLTSRDPFMSPMHLKEEAAAAKNKWCPPGAHSDALTVLNAYNAWEALQPTRNYGLAKRFCMDNFLSMPTLLLAQKLKTHILQSLYSAGVIDISAGGGLSDASKYIIPAELNTNGNCMPLLGALIAVSCQPKFAIRTSARLWRTQSEKNTMVHPSSVNHPKHAELNKQEFSRQELVAFGEKRRNVSANSGSSTFLVNTNRLESLVYALFGANTLQKDDQGLLLDDWINIVGSLDTLDDVYDLRHALDSCMTRVFEGIVMGRRKHRNLAVLPREDTSESGDDAIDETKDYSLSQVEVKELDLLSRDVVNILTQYDAERQAYARTTTPTTPRDNYHAFTRPGNPLAYNSGYSTPQTRPGTPSTLRNNYPGSGSASPYQNSRLNSRASTPIDTERRSRRF
ncbi:hypothetical protein BDP27DRAFT_1314204 [Rhodocollybia butyracea]|uniref:P-loop containing nucleoside triphosphate hydrolase protein n=1 Tax=Rhodocollybia butyracea TaxID=206335 RepID=A0A9P5Q1B2_9AGAR|nr:hypothetical protein BDP27DRAFT_1314204 [Rhodocollybia butyracea]